MREYSVSDLALMLGAIEAFCQQMGIADSTNARVLTESASKTLGTVLDGLRIACSNFDADSSLIEQIRVLSTAHQEGFADRREGVVYAQLRLITQGVENNLSKQQFLLLSSEETRYYKSLEVFGDQFKTNYSLNAARDAVEAANCFAASCYTACVFQCMRVAEHGLRKLASNTMLRVKIADRGKPCPIEYGTWNKVITAIRNKIAKIRLRPFGAKREADLQFFSNAADHCEYMKDIWRNEISHTKRLYNKEDARAVIARVKEFVIAIGEHKGSVPAEDSLVRLVQAKIDARTSITATSVATI